MRLNIIVSVILVATSGCATTPKAPPLPTSLVFERAPLARIQAAFVVTCAKDGGRVISQSANAVECAKPMGNSFKENMYKALATEQNASNPDFHFQWTFFASADGIDVNVTSGEWIEHQNAFGKTERMSIDGGEAAQLMGLIQKAWINRPNTASN